MIDRMDQRRYEVYGVCLLLLASFAALVLTKVKIFTVGYQIEEIMKYNPIFLLETLHPHALRLLAAWPAIEFAKSSGIEFAPVFGFYVLGLTYTMCVLMEKTLPYLPGGVPVSPYATWYRAIFLAVWLVILWFMNGRLIVQFVGISAMIYAQARALNEINAGERTALLRLMAFEFFGIWFSSVSSASLIVAYTEVAMFFVALVALYLHRGARLHDWRNFIWAHVGLLLLFLPFQLQSFIKNGCIYSHILASMEICQTKLFIMPVVADPEVMIQHKLIPLTGHEGPVDTAFINALNHSPIGYLAILGLPVLVIQIVFLGCLGIGLSASMLAYGYRWQTRRLFKPINIFAASLGISFCIGLFGLKAILMGLPLSMILIAAYVRFPQAKLWLAEFENVPKQKRAKKQRKTP